MKKTKVLALFLAIAMIGTGLSACGGKKDEKPAAQSKTSSTAVQSKTADKTTDKKEETPSVTSSSTGTEDKSSSAAVSSAGTSEQQTENTTTETAEKLKQILTIGYAGTDTHGSTVYWALSAKADFGVLLVVSADEANKISFVGNIISEGSKMTITDESSGRSTTVDVQQITTDEGEAGIQLTDEEGDKTVLFPVEAGTIIDAMFAADAQ